MDDQSAGMVIEPFLKFVHCFGQLLHGMHQIGINWDLGDEVSQPGHFGQHSGVSQTFQSLLESEVEGSIFNEDFKVSIIDAWDFNQRLWFRTQFLSELCHANPLGPHFIGDTVVDFVMEVQALDGPTLMLDLISWMPTTGMPVEPRRPWVVSLDVWTVTLDCGISLTLCLERTLSWVNDVRDRLMGSLPTIRGIVEDVRTIIAAEPSPARWVGVTF